MANLGGFNPNDFEEQKSFDPIPAGVYIAMITDSEMRSTRANDGEYLKLTLTIMDGPHVNRLLWTNLNLVNKNPKAVEIARKNLASICKAVGLNRPVQDSAELHNKAMKIKVDIRAAQGDWDASNVIKSYAPAQNSPAVAAPSNGGVVPPWANQGGEEKKKPQLPF
jgi:hypothetical protein|tara:strand:+ start:5553 stop:6050 length:498 start_codon:yes stop_codon:yes gene_type:complete